MKIDVKTPTDAMIDAAKKTADGVGETVIIDHTEAGFQNDALN